MSATAALRARLIPWVVPHRLAPILLTSIAFVALFERPMRLLVADWWTNPEAGHGLLLAPLGVWLAWRAGLEPRATPARPLGVLLLAIAIALRWISALAAELFTMRVAMLVAAMGLTAYFLGSRQIRRWWLPFTLATLSIPLPELVIGTVAIPLQLEASRLGAAFLDARHVPVVLTGNVIHVPGHSLFVAEACSGLRSLTALLSLGALIAGLALDRGFSRLALITLALPVAVLINGVRIFVTGFLIHTFGTRAGTGFMHATEGWLMFLAALIWLGAMAMLIRLAERWLADRKGA